MQVVGRSLRRGGSIFIRVYWEVSKNGLRLLDGVTPVTPFSGCDPTRVFFNKMGI